MAALGDVPWRPVLLRLALASPFALGIAVFEPFLDRAPAVALGAVSVSRGELAAVVIMAKFALSLCAALLLVATTGFDAVCLALARLGVPRVLVTQLSLTYRFDLDVAWSRARFTSPDPDPAVTGDHMPGAIETAIAAGASIHELGPWSASLFLRYFGPRPLIEDDSVRSSASTLLNAQVAHQVNRFLKLTLDVFNLANAQVDDISYYYTSRLPGEPAEGVNDIHLHPSEKRSFRGTVTVEF